MQCICQGIYSGNTSPSPQMLNPCSRKSWKWRSSTSPWLPLVLDLNGWLKWNSPIPRELQSSLWIFLLQGCHWSVCMIYCLSHRCSVLKQMPSARNEHGLLSSSSHLLAVTTCPNSLCLWADVNPVTAALTNAYNTDSCFISKEVLRSPSTKSGKGSGTCWLVSLCALSAFGDNFWCFSSLLLLFVQLWPALFYSPVNYDARSSKSLNFSICFIYLRVTVHVLQSTKSQEQVDAYSYCYCPTFSYLDLFPISFVPSPF